MYYTKDGQQFTSEQIKSLNPNISFAPSTFTELGYVPYTPPAPVETDEQLRFRLIAEAQARLDEFARSKGYDGILSACTYATSSIANFATEAQRCVVLRDQMWDAMYSVLDEVELGNIPKPTNLADIEQHLPELSWTVT